MVHVVQDVDEDKGWSSITSNATTLGYGQGCLTNKHSIQSGPLTGTGVLLLL